MYFRITAFAIGGLTTFLTPVLAQQTPSNVQIGTQQFEMHEIATGLEGPWELLLGPDGWLWVTERTGKRITRINPKDGTKKVAVTIDEVSAPGGQDGLLGMTLDRKFGEGQNYVYVAYQYNDAKKINDLVKDDSSPYHTLWTKIVRYEWDANSETLGKPVVLIEGMPGSNDHNSGRLKYGPDDKLYYTIGDQGNNQLGNWCRPILAQQLPTADEIKSQNYWAYQGKSLRLNVDGSIPDDNPELDGVRSHVFTYGHRNMQGIDFGPDGKLYTSEQGPKTDDEINILKSGSNYGWPHVAGFVDRNEYVFADWAGNVDCANLAFSDLKIADGVKTVPETEWERPKNYVEPRATMFTVPDAWDFAMKECGGIDYICWPTVAPSSVEYYNSDAIPGWKGSLLIPTLKRGSLYIGHVSVDGEVIKQPFIRYFQTENRLRDTAVSEDGLTIYIATDPSGLVEGLQGGVVKQMANPGAILAYTYKGEGDPSTAPSPKAADPVVIPEKSEAGSAEKDAALKGNAPDFTAAQATEGAKLYASHCAACHGADLRAANYGPPIAGLYFNENWGGKAVSALIEKVKEMPPSAPDSLSDAEHLALAAHILSVNGATATDAELSADSKVVIGRR